MRVDSGSLWRDGIQVQRRQTPYWRTLLPWPAASTASCGPTQTHQSGPIETTFETTLFETTFETTAKNAGARVAAGPAFGLVRQAVAAGFEPAEGCPSRAFEARSLGRSDTPPPERLPKGGARPRVRSMIVRVRLVCSTV